MKKLIWLLVITIIVAGCGNEETSTTQKPTIYTTNYATKYIIKQIVKENANVYTIYDNADTANTDNFTYTTSNPDTYTFKDNQKKLELVLKSDAFIYNGLDKNDKRILNEIIEKDKDEEILLFDSTLNANKSTLSAQVNLTYNNKIVDNAINTLLVPKNEPSMFWISPIEMMNNSQEIYNFIIELFQNKEEELKGNYDDLLFELNSLYSYVDNIYESNTNNVFVSDSYQLNLMHIHYLTNIYTNQTENKLHADDETNEDYLAEINKYLVIDEKTMISTTDLTSENYFDLLVVLSEENYNSGKDFPVIMRENYDIVNKVLKTP